MIEARFLHEFDYLGNTAYLDVCSLGLQPRRTLERCEDFQREFVRTRGRICLDAYSGLRRQAAARFAALIGASPDEIFFTGNTTGGFQQLCAGLPFRPGEKVVLSPADYPSVYSGWAARGIEAVLLPHPDGCVPEEAILSAIEQPGVRAVSVSFVLSASGYRLDLARIGRACRAKGVFFCVDAIQGLGRNAVDVERDCIDILSCGGFKALMGVLGTGAHYCRRELLDRMQPSGWDNHNLQVSFESGRMSACRAIEDAFGLAAGSENTYGIEALSTSLSLLLEIGIPAIEAHVRALERHYRTMLAPLKLHWLGSPEEAHWSGNAVFRMDPVLRPRLLEAMREADIVAYVHPDKLRVGFHFYNTEEHADRMADVIRSVFRADC